MEKSSKYFRDLGWAQLSGRWTPAVIFTFVYSLITTVVSFIDICLIFTILLFPMQYSYNVAFLDDKRNPQELRIGSLFDGYKDFLRIFGTMLLQFVYTLLWTLLLIVPGIIKGISYSQTIYILKDNPELSYNATIERSMAMMEGHKMQYFILILTFLGWIFLGIITCGIMFLLVHPYMAATNAHFYEYVKEEYENRIKA